MVCFFKANPEARGYRKRMIETWTERGNQEISEGRLACQKDYILRNKIFSDVELSRIKQRAANTGTDDKESPNDKEDEEDEEMSSSIQEEDSQENGVYQDVLDKEHSKIREHILSVMEENDNRYRLPPLRTVRRKQLLKEVSKVNQVVRTIATSNLSETNLLMYAAAKVVTEALGLLPKAQGPRKQNFQTAPWKRRLQGKIEYLRKDLSLIEAIKNGTLKKRKVEMKLAIKYTLGKKTHQEVSEDLRQRIVACEKKITRYEKRIRQYKQNKMMLTDQKRLYQQLGGEVGGLTNEAPNSEEATAFWQKLWDRPVTHNGQAPWIVKCENRGTFEQTPVVITTSKVRKQVSKMKNWKAAGPDQVQAFWLKELNHLHGRLANQMQKAIQEGIPNWLGTGRTVLIMKDKEKGAIVENYRPITCLPTTWKLLSSIIAEEIYQHLDHYKLIPVEQKGCRKESRGAKDQLLIDKMVLKDCKQRKTNLYATWIDYKKAYDSVPHSWILKSLELMKVNREVIRFLSMSMEKWNTQLMINGEEIGQCKIRRGIFQGDSLSPLLFVISMIPLTQILHKTGAGYQLGKEGEKINHLLYMDDLKLYGKSKAEIRQLVTAVSEFSKDICMEFGLAKCAAMVMEHGKMRDCTGLDLPDMQQIQGLSGDEQYKYLGMLEADSIKQTIMKEKTREEYFKRLKKILKSDLNAGNVVKAINTWAVSAFRYSSGILDWTRAELARMDTKTRKILTIYGMHHPKACVNRLYLPRCEGGRGLQSIAQCVEEDKRSLADYIKNSKERILSKVKDANLIKSEGNKKEFKKKMMSDRTNEWKAMPLYGQYPRQVENITKKEETYQWLITGTLKKETEGLIVAAQDQALRTNCIKVKIDKQVGSPMCRLCGSKEETVDHLVSSCSKIAQTDYKSRHDKVAANLHWSLCKQFGFQRAEKWWEHRAEKALENEEYKLLWDYDIQVDRTIKERRPDLVVVNKKLKEAWIVDVAVPGDARVASKEIEKQDKYRDLAIELQRLWELKKVKVIPVVIGALGTVPVALKKHLRAMKVDDVKVEHLQKTAILGTAYILRRYLGAD